MEYSLSSTRESSNILTLPCRMWLLVLTTATLSHIFNTRRRDFLRLLPGRIPCFPAFPNFCSVLRWTAEETRLLRIYFIRRIFFTPATKFCWFWKNLLLVFFMQCRHDVKVSNDQPDTNTATEVAEKTTPLLWPLDTVTRKIAIVLEYSGRFSSISLSIGSWASRPEITHYDLSV